MLRGALAVLLLALFAHPALAEDVKPADLNDYLQLVSKLKEEPLDRQVELMKSYLTEHPDSRFRPEIESNVKKLEELLDKTDPKRKKEARDTQRYMRAVAFSKKLTPADQIALWQQFLEENPDSIYRSEVNVKLGELKKLNPQAPPPATSTPSQNVPVVPEQSEKDRNKAMLLATFPGLIVPGIGHWYAKDYASASVLTGIRIGGLAVGIPGIVEGNTALIVVGALLCGFSYIYDVAASPYAVDRYNEEKVGAISPYLRGRPGSFDVAFSLDF